MALDKDIPESSTWDEHRIGHCIFKDRIKLVLLYQVSNIQDKGESARKLLKGCLIRELATAAMGGYLCHYDRLSTYGPDHM